MYALKNKKFSKVMSFLLAFCMILTFAYSIPDVALADAQETVAIQVTDKAGETKTLATWTYDSQNTTYIDNGTGQELALVKDFTQSANLKGSVNGAAYDFSDLGCLAYTGTNKKPDCRCLAVTTKGILIDDMYAYAGTLLGKGGVELLKSDAVKLKFCLDSSATNEYTYDEYWGATKYYYPDWYSFGANADGLVDEAQQTNARVVPSTLAICGYHATTGATAEGLKAIADSVNALRNTQGQQQGGAAKETDANMGFNSVRNISVIQFTLDKTFAEAGVGVEEETFDTSWYDPAATSYVINTAEQLEGLAAIVNGTAANIEKSDFQGKTVTLGKDIALNSEENWVAIGNADSPFAGTFDGKKHEISGLKIDDATGGYKGLFGNNTGTVKDFTISGTIGTVAAPITTGADNIGGAVGYNNGTVSGITGKVTICVDTTSIYAVGGIVGQNGPDGKVENSANSARILATKCGGGVVGRNFGVVNACANSGAVSGGGADGSHGQGKDSIGGIVGQAGDKKCTYTATVTNCYNTGAISNPAGRWFGGIAGFADTNSVIKNCYSIGTIDTGYSWNWNPIIGNVDSADCPNISNNYSLEGLNAGDTTENTMLITIGTIKTTDEFKAADMLTLLNADGKNFVADSKNINDGYPVLSWQVPVSHSSGGSSGGSSVKKPEQDNNNDDHQNNNENTNNDFTDTKGHWAADAIYFVVKENLFTGTTATTFEPETAMNRAMLVTVLWRLEGKPAASGSVNFNDLASGAYYADAVAWANANGIVKGYSETQFAPNDKVTREQMAAILCRYAENKGYDVSGTADLNSFADNSKLSAYAVDNLKWAKAAGLMNGRTETTLAPQGDSTRAEVATMIQRFVQNVVK